MSGSIFQSLSDLVAHFENPSGNPTLLNSQYDATHTASGLYQVTNTTWAGFGGYPTAASAPVDVQQAQFAQMVGARGLADYTCPGCDPALTSYVNANPSALSLPVFNASGTGSTTPGSGSIWDWLFNPPAVGPGDYGNPGAAPDPSGSLGGAAAAPPEGPGKAIVNGANAVAGGASSIFQPVFDWLGGISTRLGLFVLAIIFIIGALVLFGIKSGVEVQTGGTP